MADPFTIALVSAAATGLQVVGQIQQGKAANKAAQYQAAQYEVNAKQAEIAAGQERAASQRVAHERRRNATLLASKAQAIGASGGGGLDPSTVDIISDIDAEGEYGALAALYQGEEAAMGREDQARMNLAQAGASRYEGKVAKQQGYYNAAGTAGSYFTKYGADVFGTQSAAPIEYRDPNSSAIGRVYG